METQHNTHAIVAPMLNFLKLNNTMKHYYYVYRTQYELDSMVKHDTIQSAQKEAEQLASQNPGESFEILLCVGISSTPAVRASTFWVDGFFSENLKN